jgi:hypothetical protein
MRKATAGWTVSFGAIIALTMRSATGFLAAIALAAFPAGTVAEERFDGKWLTTVSCEGARDALGYSFRFVSEVKNGHFRGLRGTEGKPSSLLIDGTVSADGSAKLYATGRTGSKEYVPGRDTPRGTEYSYSIEAHFKDATGSGTRVEGRACSFQFEKQ